MASPGFLRQPSDPPPIAIGLAWCAWCGEVIEAFYVDGYGVRYHTACWAHRVDILSIAGVGPAEP